MAKIALIYYSQHHGNTKKLVEGISQSCPVDLIALPLRSTIDFSKYDAVGFASGIYLSKLHQIIFSFLAQHRFPERCKKAFVLYTSGSGGTKYANSFVKKLVADGFEVLGVYQCRGFDTYGPIKWIGGIAKGRPNEKDIARAVGFMRETVLPQLEG